MRPGPHGLEAFQRRLHPILLIEGQEDPLVRLLADDGPQQVADRRLVRLAGEIGLQQPGAAILGLEGCDGRLGRIEDLADHVGHGARGAPVRGDAEDVGGAVRVQTFEHDPALEHRTLK